MSKICGAASSAATADSTEPGSSSTAAEEAAARRNGGGGGEGRDDEGGRAGDGGGTGFATARRRARGTQMMGEEERPTSAAGNAGRFRDDEGTSGASVRRRHPPWTKPDAGSDGAASATGTATAESTSASSSSSSSTSFSSSSEAGCGIVVDDDREGRRKERRRRNRSPSPTEEIESPTSTTRRALAAFLVHYAVALPSSFAAHDAMFPAPQKMEQEEQEQEGGTDVAAALFLCLYGTGMLAWRTAFYDSRFQSTASVLYQHTWLCNVTILASGVSLLVGRPLLAQSHCVVVGIDQILWYVDLAAYAAIGKFPVGVCKYLIRENKNAGGRGTGGNVEPAWYRSPILTCTHHLWTIPVVIWASGRCHSYQRRRQQQQQQLIHDEVPVEGRGEPRGERVDGWWPPEILLLSFFVMTVNVCLSRLLTPKAVTIRPSSSRLCSGDGDEKAEQQQLQQNGAVSYLNVNLSHAVWKDLFFFKESRREPSAFEHLFWLLLRWQALNVVVFYVLRYASTALSSRSFSSS